MVPERSFRLRGAAIVAALALALVASACEYRPLHGEATHASPEPAASSPSEPSSGPETSAPGPEETEGLPSEEPTFPPPTPVPAEVSTLAGSGAAAFADGPAGSAQFQFPAGVAVDGAGTVFVADTGNNRIRKVDAGGTVTTVAGSGVAGSADGSATAAQFNHPRGVAVDEGGTIYVADTGNNTIRAVSPDGSVSTIAGSGAAGTKNAPGRSATFNAPVGIAIGAGSTIYVADFQGNVIRRIAPSTSLVTTLAGSGRAGFADGSGPTATFNAPYGLATDAAGNVYVADAGNNRIRKVTPDGVVSTVAGVASAGFLDGTKTARFNAPEGIAAAPDGTLFVADFGNDAVRRIDPKGRVTTLAGSGEGFADGSSAQAKLANPSGIARGRSGLLFVADSSNNRIRRLAIG